jgi:hypothetical protein
MRTLNRRLDRWHRYAARTYWNPRYTAPRRLLPRSAVLCSPGHVLARLAHGIPDQLDRTKALGNAVVHQVAEHIGRLIRDHAEQAALAGGAR